MASIEISQAKRAMNTSRKWMRKHANRSQEHKQISIVPNIPHDAIYAIIEYFLMYDSKRDPLQDLDPCIIQGIRQLDEFEVDLVMDLIEETLDDTQGVIDMNDLYVKISNV